MEGCKYVLLYVTCANKEEAYRIAELSLNYKCVACVNVMGASVSFYSLSGKVKRDEEVVAFFKTTKSKVLELMSLIKENHSYECPCIIELPIVGGSDKYLDWIDKSM